LTGGLEELYPILPHHPGIWLEFIARLASKIQLLGWPVLHVSSCYLTLFKPNLGLILD